MFEWGLPNNSYANGRYGGMPMVHVLRRCAAFAIATTVLALTASIASADGPGWETISQDFEGPLFGLNVGYDGKLLVADSGAGPTKLDADDGDTSLIASLPNVTDVIQVGRREYIAVTGGEPEPGSGPPSTLYRIKKGHVTKIADLLAFEEAKDPAQDGVESNPFDLARLSRNKVLVADAAGNDILVVDKKGKVDWVASLPQHDVPTQPVKDLVGCPTPADPSLAEICGLPEIMNADPVATTVAVGPDGAIYAGELTGDPGTPGFSRVWRIEPDARHVRCGTDDDECTLVDTPPFTSIIDINFGEDGTAYVVEFDENSWLSIFFGLGAGGTMNACRSSDHDDDGDDDSDNGGVTWTCEEVATGLPTPTAVALDDESIYVTLIHFLEGPFEVAQLTGTDSEKDDNHEDDD